MTGANCAGVSVSQDVEENIKKVGKALGTIASLCRLVMRGAELNPCDDSLIVIDLHG